MSSSLLLSRCSCLRPTSLFLSSTAARPSPLPSLRRALSSTPTLAAYDRRDSLSFSSGGGGGGGNGGNGGNGGGGGGGQRRPRRNNGGGGGGPGGGQGVDRQRRQSAPRPSSFSFPPSSAFSSPSSTTDDWTLHVPSSNLTSTGSGPRTTLSPSKLHAQSRQRERIASINPEKARWASEAGERILDRVTRSAEAVGMGEEDLGGDLDEKRRRSRKFRAYGEEGRGAPAGAKRGTRGAAGRGEREGAASGAAGGGGAGGREARQKLVPGQANWKRDREEQRVAATPVVQKKKPARAKVRERVLRKVELPSTLRLDNLVNILKLRLFTVQKAAERIGLTDVRADRLLTSEDASLLCLELGFDPIIDDEAAFDLYALPPPTAAELATLPLRPPITGIFGHVDHGKTSLLDALRSTTVAAGEAGGITQHIGAFEVPVASMVANLRAKAEGKPAPPLKPHKDGDATITFLDTPGHAAFTAMRSRGAGVTDVVVLVVAADDGVKPQTEEVIALIKSAGDSLGVVVALTKVDKPGVDTLKVKQGLMAAGVEIEDFGGDVPCVEVSSLTGKGMPELLETVSAIAEVRELKASREGRVEGRVIESRVEKGRGNVATVLVLRGCLKPSSSLVAGTTWARVRTLLPPSGRAIPAAYPGQPVEVTGWKDLPSAGDLVLEAPSEDDAKRAVANRLRRVEDEKMWSDVEVINEKQRRDAEILQLRREEEEKARAKGLKGNAVVYAGNAAVEGLEDGAGAGDVKELLLIVKADVSGTVEAVVGALEGIGNKEAKVKILSSAVGEVTQADVEMAKAVGATIIGFNVKAAGSIMKEAAKGPTPVAVHTSPIIYRLVDTVRQATADLLPKTVETRVHGEATVQMVFEISVKGRKEPKKIAGSKVFNGTFAKARKARLVRKGEVLFTGTVSTLKQVKKDVDQIPKGVECGIALEEWDDIVEGDTLQSIEEIEVSRSL
ncbi:hypothetical protein JCM6882_000999 [Rhodosporidiobolus microsporus]